MAETRLFCMVIREDGSGSERTSSRYESMPVAMKEAERLCRKEGAAFVVLEAVSVCRPVSPPVVWEPLS